MSAAFFDITGRQGNIYIFEGKPRRLRESIPFTIEKGIEFRVEEIPPDVKDSYVSVPLDLINFRVLDLPLRDMDKIRSVLPYELEGLMLGDPQSVVIDARMLGNKVLAAYVDKSVLRGLLSALEKLGMDPRAVTSIDLGAALGEAADENELIRVIGKRLLVEGEGRVESAAREIDECTVNFRRGEFSFRGEAQKIRRSLKLTASLALLLVLFFSADMALRTLGANREAAALERSILKTYSEIFPGRKATAAGGLNYTMRSELKALREKDAALRDVSPLRFLMRLQELSSTSYSLSNIVLEGETVVLKGEAASLSDVQHLKSGLEGFLEQVVISDTGESAAGRIAFTITAREGWE